MVRLIRKAYPRCKLPENQNQPAFRYMNISKFRYLVEKKSLYLCRADRLQDKFEGRYSYRQILDTDEWLKQQGVPDVVDSEKEEREKIRKQTYISCWCLGETDLDLIWKAYIPNDDGIAIKTSVKKLIKLCDNSIGFWPLDISEVTYYDQMKGGFIDYDRLTPFCHKDMHFHLDNENRIIYHPNIQLPSPEYIDLPINCKELIDEIILKPKSSVENLQDVKYLLKQCGLSNIPILYSRDDRSVAI